MTEEQSQPRRGLENATIPVGGGLWRALGKNGALVVGYTIAAVHIGIITLDLVLMPHGSGESAWETATMNSTLLGPILGFTFICLGEIIRRGDWGGPSGHKPRAMLPQGSNTMTLRVVPYRWLGLWLVVSLVAAVALLVALADNPYSYRDTVWIVNGIIAAGAVGAVTASLVKRWVWFHGGRERARALREVKVHPALANRRGPSLSTRFWRSFGFRWRFDIWSSAFGLIFVWIAAWVLVTASPAADSAELVPGYIALAAGVLVFAGGLWAATQFWRAGEDLTAAESVA